MASWPHSYGDDPRLNEGLSLSPDELATFPFEEVFVRCEACNGSGHDGGRECGGTGFDFSYTQEARATLRALVTLGPGGSDAE